MLNNILILIVFILLPIWEIIIRLPCPTAPPKHKGWYSRNYLPHFDAPDLYQSLTFRLHDAIPQEVLLRLEGEARLGMITDLERRRNIERYMDAGHGACWLRRPAVARIVYDVLMHFDGERYRLLAWCVMPNHVHVLMETFEGDKCKSQIVFHNEAKTSEKAEFTRK
ncbi:MAG: hypothetical protein BECKG1743D_GA0114223_100846 [Candidatus Kentron sp. G]|nr:MAG: hypothetical protein BECKG1743F_GA0114225_100736 [Candidatus Kentron sp. G]VFM98796.1 MAG: hypothetical protein BECKG1743D_GA0114223_100846 [Candidatus Kentron sp. G]VFN02874.1 MAG: hypothetical protein BECKG1743E_GA0114224_105533 [Candidatus Kentron sp. G]